MEEAVHVEQGACHGVWSRPLEKATCFIIDHYRFFRVYDLVVWATAVHGRSEANVHRSQNGELCGVQIK